MKGLLIVNADDWGGYAEGTDAIARAYAAGAITSATAMVHMADSARAAELAADVGLPLGLHLNLTQAFDGPGIPPAVRDRQLACVARYRPAQRLNRWRYDPRPSIAALVRSAVADQLEEFRRLYRREPTHLDSHMHAHATPDVLLRLPRGVKVRRTASRHAGILLARRHPTTEQFHGFRHLIAELGGHGLAAVLRDAEDHSIEIMVHPSFEEELPLLLAERWTGALQTAPLGSFADLDP